MQVNGQLQLGFQDLAPAARSGLKDLLPNDTECLYHTGKGVYVCCCRGRPLEFCGGNVSPEEASSPSCCLDTSLNPSSALPGMIHQVLVATSIAHEGDQLVDHMAHNIPKRDQAIAGYSRK